MSKGMGILFVAVACLCLASSVYAGQRGMNSASPWTTKQQWVEKADGKLYYGAKNLLLGWTELFTEPFDAYREKRNIAGGVWEGLGNAIGQTVGGAAHVATFPITQIDVPLPEGGTQIF